jgi:hypothetical protein
MVAYSFKKPFVPMIQLGRKQQTIRGPRLRHARVGEPIQLYCGMRTAQCFRIIPDPICCDVVPIHILRPLGTIQRITLGCGIIVSDLDKFAWDDGFSGINAMSNFWRQAHPGTEDFLGVLIRWVLA